MGKIETLRHVIMTYTDHVHADVVQLTALLIASAHKHCADDFFNFVFNYMCDKDIAVCMDVFL